MKRRSRRRKLTVMLILLYLNYWLLTMTGCQTLCPNPEPEIIYIYPEYQLPAEPERETISMPEIVWEDETIINGVETVRGLLTILNYYETLLQEHEAWIDTTKEIVKVEN